MFAHLVGHSQNKLFSIQGFKQMLLPNVPLRGCFLKWHSSWEYLYDWTAIFIRNPLSVSLCISFYFFIIINPFPVSLYISFCYLCIMFLFILSDIRKLIDQLSVDTGHIWKRKGRNHFRSVGRYEQIHPLYEYEEKIALQPVEAGKGKKINSPLEPLEGMHLCRHLDFSLVDLYRTSNLYNCKIINLYHFKQLSLW